MFNTKIQKYKADGRIKRYDEMTEAQYQVVGGEILQWLVDERKRSGRPPLPGMLRLMHEEFKLHDGKVVKETFKLAEIPARAHHDDAIAVHALERRALAFRRHRPHPPRTVGDLDDARRSRAVDLPVASPSCHREFPAARSARHRALRGSDVPRPAGAFTGRSTGCCSRRWSATRLGIAVGPCLGYMLAFVVATNSLELSQGFVGHSTQMEGLVLLAQFAATIWAFAIGPDARCRDRTSARRSRDDLMMDWTRQGIAASYVVAGITKLINSNGQWLNRSGFFVLQVQKAQGEAYYTAGVRANPASMAFLSALGQWPLLAAAVSRRRTAAGTVRLSRRLEPSAGARRRAAAARLSRDARAR